MNATRAPCSLARRSTAAAIVGATVSKCVVFRSETVRGEIDRLVGWIVEKDQIGRSLDFDARQNRREQRARALVAHRCGGDAPAAFLHGLLPPKIERADRLCEDHRPLPGPNAGANDAGIIEQALETGRRLQQTAGAGEDDVAAFDRLADRNEVHARRRRDAVLVSGFRRMLRKDVDRRERIARLQLRDELGEQRLVAEIAEAVVSAD